MSATAPRRHLGFWALAAGAAVVIVILSALLAVALTRQTPVPVAATPTPTPTPASSPSPDAAAVQKDHQEYRAYVSSVLQSGAAVVASLTGLAGCRDDRDQCATNLHAAGDEVASMQSTLNANPPPECLTTADAMLRDALTFMQKGMDAAETGVRSENRVRLVQGALLTAAGTWRAGQAVVTARQSDC